MQRRIAYLITLLMALSGTTFVSLTVASSPAQAKDVNCSDFNTQAAAQQYFLNHGGPNSDPDGLDADGDGVACESNSCPCSYGTGGGGGGGNPPPHHRKPKHKISARGQEVRNTNRFIAVGRVFTFPNGRIQILRKAGGAYRPYKFVHTKKVTGKFRTGIKQVGSRRTCFRVVAPETKKYQKTTKDIGCIINQ